jgi:large subunit ribosomal protein L31
LWFLVLSIKIRAQLFNSYGAWQRSSGDAALTEVSMKDGIHPAYGQLTATCSCGNVIKTGSTSTKELHLDVCSECHPFYTGKQKAAETGGRVDKFNKRFGALSKK